MLCSHHRRAPLMASVGRNHVEAIASSPKGKTMWLVAAGVLISVCTFAATFFAYSPPRAPAGYAPAIVGIGLFFASMTCVGYFAQSKGGRSARIGKALGVALAETVAFTLLLLFLVLNIFGA
jgi:hypothetical protein